MAADANFKYCEISAPITGRISELIVDPHNLVGDNEATLLCTIIDESQMRVYFEADERRSLEFLRRRKGYEDANQTPPKATLSLADGTVYEQEAQIELADNRLDKDTGTLLIRATVPNPNRKLADGLFVRVKVPRPQINEGAILISETAIQEDIGGKFVLTVGDDNKVVRKNIELTPDRIEGLRIVDSGLTGTEKIIVSGIQRVREGMPVAPSEVPLESAEPAAAPAAPAPSPSEEN
jgi:RND family efflux transporter MFP subunit